MRSSPLGEPAVKCLGAILGLLRAFDLIALAMRWDEIVCRVLATVAALLALGALVGVTEKRRRKPRGFSLGS